MSPDYPHDALCDRTIDLLGLADCHRWVVIKTLRNQSVAEHSYNVAVIAWELANRLHVSDEWVTPVLLWALIHDVPETYIGDVDGRAKREFPALKAAIADAERAKFPWYRDMSDHTTTAVCDLVKVADTIEAVTFIKTWGRGERANDVFYELQYNLFHFYTVALAASMGLNRVEVDTAVALILNQSTHERNSVQFRDRRDRKKTAATET